MSAVCRCLTQTLTSFSQKPWEAGYPSSNCTGRERGLERDKTTVTQLLRDMDGIELQAVVFWLSKKKKKKALICGQLLWCNYSHQGPWSISSYQQGTYKIPKGFTVASCKLIATSTSWLKRTSVLPQMRPLSTALNE